MFTFGTLTADTDLSPLQLRTFYRAIGKSTQPEADDELTRLDCFTFWVFLLIQRLKFLAPEQQILLFDELLPHLATLLNKFELDVPVMLVFRDGRYVTWSGNLDWLDTTDGQYNTEPDCYALETIGYNLVALFQRNDTACKRKLK